MSSFVSCIKGIGIQGQWCEDQSKVKSYVKAFFENKFGTLLISRIALENINFPSLTNEDNNVLTN